MSVKHGDTRPIARGGGSPAYERRAVVGSSGRPREGMVMRSGTQDVAKTLGKYSRKDGFRTSGAMSFDVDAIKDQSIGAPGDGSEGGNIKVPA